MNLCNEGLCNCPAGVDHSPFVALFPCILFPKRKQNSLWLLLSCCACGVGRLRSNAGFKGFMDLVCYGVGAVKKLRRVWSDKRGGVNVVFALGVVGLCSNAGFRGFVAPRIKVFGDARIL